MYPIGFRPIIIEFWTPNTLFVAEIFLHGFMVHSHCPNFVFTLTESESDTETQKKMACMKLNRSVYT